MKNRNILILQCAIAVVLFCPVLNPCLAQAKPGKQLTKKDTAVLRADTSQLKPDALNEESWANSNLHLQKNQKTVAINSVYPFSKTGKKNTIHRAGSKFILTQPADISAPDLIAEKPMGRFSGWIGYTTSRTENPFDTSNDFNWFPAVQDRIHDFSLVGTYRFTDRFTFSGNLIQSNGNLVYGPSGYTFNSYQVGNNVRFDFNATIQGQPHQNFRNSWSVGIYNLNGYWNSGVSGAGVVENKILPKPVPSVSWNLKFH